MGFVQDHQQIDVGMLLPKGLVSRAAVNSEAGEVASQNLCESLAGVPDGRGHGCFVGHVITLQDFQAMENHQDNECGCDPANGEGPHGRKGMATARECAKARFPVLLRNQPSRGYGNQKSADR